MGVVRPNVHIPLVDLAAQYQTLQSEIRDAIDGVLTRCDFVLGEAVERFEAEFAVYCGAGQAVGVASGFSAVELALRAFDIGPGDEVITAANTYIATALGITSTGAAVVLVEMDPVTYNIDVNRIEDAITEHTRAIVPVHLYGQPADMDAVMEIAQRRNLIVVEDAAQAHGARYKGNRAGCLGHAAAFSFYPSKNLGAYGDGGIVVSNDPEVINRIRLLRNYGQSRKNYHVVQGANQRLDTIQAAVLRVKLPYLDQWNAARRECAARYNRLLAGTSLRLPQVPDFAEPVWHLYIVQTENRDELKDYLATRGIFAGIHYPIPIHLQPAYQSLGYGRGAFPETERYADRTLSLPIYAELTVEQSEYVASTIKDFLAKRTV